MTGTVEAVTPEWVAENGRWVRWSAGNRPHPSGLRGGSTDGTCLRLAVFECPVPGKESTLSFSVEDNGVSRHAVERRALGAINEMAAT